VLGAMEMVQDTDVLYCIVVSTVQGTCERDLFGPEGEGSNDEYPSHEDKAEELD